MEKVTIECHTNARYPGTVYAAVKGEDASVSVSATLDYCLSACIQNALEIVNAQEVLMWLHKNAEFKAYK